MAKYKPLAIGDISTVSMEEWASHWRVHGSGWNDPRPDNPCYLKRAYGGSDIATIMGISPWKTRLQLFHEKVGVIPSFKRTFNSDAKELGHIYETPTALKYHFFKRKKGIKNLTLFVEGYIVDPDGNFRVDSNGERVKNPISMQMYRDGRKNKDGSFLYPFALANCDGFIKEGNRNGGLEIKTTSSLNVEGIKKLKEGIIPPHYITQIVWYMGILNLDFFDFVCSWGQGLEEMVVIRFERDLKLEKQIFDAVAEFDEYVEQGIEPDVSTEKGELLMNYYYELFGPVDESEPYIELPEKFRNTVMRGIQLEKDIDELKKQLKELENKKADIHAELYPIFKTASYGQLRLDDNTVAGITLKTPMKRAKFDLDRFEKEQPTLFSQFQTSVFDCKAFETSSKENKKLKKTYMLPAEPDLESTAKKPGFSIKLLNRPVSK